MQFSNYFRSIDLQAPEVKNDSKKIHSKQNIKFMIFKKKKLPKNQSRNKKNDQGTRHSNINYDNFKGKENNTLEGGERKCVAKGGFLKSLNKWKKNTMDVPLGFGLK